MAEGYVDADDIIFEDDSGSASERGGTPKKKGSAGTGASADSFVAFVTPRAAHRSSKGEPRSSHHSSRDEGGSKPRRVSFVNDAAAASLTPPPCHLDDVSCTSAETQGDSPFVGPARTSPKGSPQKGRVVAGTGAAGARRMSSTKRFQQKYGNGPDAGNGGAGLQRQSSRKMSRRLSDNPASGLLRRRSSVASTMSAQARERKMSMATYAVHTREKNVEFAKVQNYGISDLKSSRDELESFMAEDGWVEKSGLGVQGFRMACMASIKEHLGNKKMTKRLMNKLAKKKLAKNMGVLNTEERQAEAARRSSEEVPAAAAAAAPADAADGPQYREMPASLRGAPEDAPAAAAAPPPPQSVYFSAAEYFKEEPSMSSRFENAQLQSIALARAATENRRAPDPFGDRQSPLFTQRMRHKPRPSSAPIWGRGRQTSAVYSTHEPPAVSAWKQRNFHTANTPVSLALNNTEPDTMQRVQTRVNWSGMMAAQKEELDKLEYADSGYRGMLGSYKEIQKLIQQRMERLLISAGVE
eukprot:TRINITY_DN10321_c0_g1_i1.p1 TRINITY_DN10321_c0_g1~~TRINITY_DN10321_c0_g1_i1.p1  ORF type:complete len:526 (+),score=182.77 TRINITY_DN10321_c0_g1_i1:69-1646(+)